MNMQTISRKTVAFAMAATLAFCCTFLAFGASSAHAVETTGGSPSKAAVQKPALPTLNVMKKGFTSIKFAITQEGTVSGYHVRFKAKGGVWKSKYITKKIFKVKKAKLNHEYYVKVRAYTKKNGKKVYGKWSKVRSCKFTYDMDNYDYCMGQGDYYKAQYELQKSKRASLMKTGPGMYNPALAQNDPTYRTRYYQQVREHNAKISEAESNMEYYEKLMNEWYADATSQYWFYGYPRY